MDIAATHLRVTLAPSAPTWTSRFHRAMTSKSVGPGLITDLTTTDNAQQPETQIQTVEEIVVFPERGANDDPFAGIVNAGMQAIQALRTRVSTDLDGCGINVRVGMSLASISIVPLDFSVGSTPSDRHLKLIAQGVVLEALGADAPTQQVRYEVQADNEHFCVVALGASLLSSIQAMCETQRLKFASCQPAIVEQLDREMAASARGRDTRTLVWTELDASGKRHALVNFLRIASGSVVNAWRTVVPTLLENAGSDQSLKASTDRFLIATGVAEDEPVVVCAWPSLSLESSSMATKELQA